MIISVLLEIYLLIANWKATFNPIIKKYKCFFQGSNPTGNNQVRASQLRYIPSEKIGQNFHPSESCFFVINYQHWTGRSAFGPFLALLDHGGGLGGPGGVMRGLKTLKMTLSIGDHLRPWNGLFWLLTISYTMFLWFWVKTGPSGPKKGRFWPK